MIEQVVLSHFRELNGKKLGSKSLKVNHFQTKEERAKFLALRNPKQEETTKKASSGIIF